MVLVVLVLLETVGGYPGCDGHRNVRFVAEK